MNGALPLAPFILASAGTGVSNTNPLPSLEMPLSVWKAVFVCFFAIFTSFLPARGVCVGVGGGGSNTKHQTPNYSPERLVGFFANFAAFLSML